VASNLNEFCTLFDVNYLPRGLVLYRSLARVCPQFRLRVFCMDAETERILKRLALPNLVVVGLDELERHDPELLEVKPTRTQVEYCWTATPAILVYCLETEPDLDAITYLDADLMFFADPAPLFEELGDDSTLIVPHRYAPPWVSYAETSGIYNVEFMTFRRDPRGLEALGWWRDRCIEWCYYRVEDGKLGDQKYLDDWPERFEGVHVLAHLGGGLAPWNAEQYRIEQSGGGLTVDGQELVFYHYHSLKLIRGITHLRVLGLVSEQYQLTRRPLPLVWRQNYSMSPIERNLIWEPYLRELGAALLDLRRQEGRFEAGFTPVDSRVVGRQLATKVRRPLTAGRDRAAAAGSALLKRRRADYRQSWREPGVAAKMGALAEKQLVDPGAVAPYRAFVEIARSLVESYPLADPARLLDFGCGVGHYSELIETTFPHRFVYTGCDYAESMVAAARRRWPGREFLVNDLFANTLDLAEYDVILAGALVDIVPEWERALDVLLGSSAPYVVLHRQQVVENGASRIEVVPGYEGQMTYRTYLTRDALGSSAASHGYAIVEECEVDGPIRTFLLRSGDS
jgi:SAM-dependent methyltransferase